MPSARFFAGALQCHDGILAKRSSRGIIAAGEAGNEHEALAALIIDADGQTAKLIPQIIAFTGGRWPERPQLSVGQRFHADLLPKGNVGATNWLIFNVAR